MGSAGATQAPPVLPSARSASSVASPEDPSAALGDTRGGEHDEPSAEQRALFSALFSARFAQLSEPDRSFFSDNYVSNETSYLQVAAQLARGRPGGAYLGVGPEQNFSYIAKARPERAYILDIRRGNALLHLLYKAIFAESPGRLTFLARLMGHDGALEAAGRKAPSAEHPEGVAQVIARLPEGRPAPDEAARVHARLARHIEALGVKLSEADRETLWRAHQAFIDAGLGLRFTLHEENGRSYPSLEELLSARHQGQGSFLETAEDYAFVKALQDSHRVIPVVGDFAGEHALRQIAAELRRDALPVRVFYTSNVEQYLAEPATWARWVANLKALPTEPDSVFVRAYLDQGRRHPAQLPGHRTATLLQRFEAFHARQATRGYRSFWELVSDTDDSP
ncbi:MAG: hypothetical protein KIT72_09150 [Polyangiaceae bacterium]|nr:hypothetical protein [Polyangiaceae bacterium]MCW5790575.1 hypothetical protein [Polyangiaceae bacterium]